MRLMTRDKHVWASFGRSQGNYRYFHIMMSGPTGTPYEGWVFIGWHFNMTTGGNYRMELFLPEGYPMEPPKAR